MVCRVLANSDLVQYRQYREEFEKENLYLKNEVSIQVPGNPTARLHSYLILTTAQLAKLKLDFDAAKRQNDSLQQLLRERREITIPPQKQRQVPEDDGEDDDDDDDDVENRLPRRERARAKPSNFSRDQIRFVLGGFDRGWGSTQ